MHELPKDLTNRLKSFRGSIYGSRAGSEYQDADAEKGAEAGYNDDEIDRAMDSDSSIMMEPHRTYSDKRRSPAQSRQDDQNYFDLEKQDWGHSHPTRQTRPRRHSVDSHAAAGIRRSTASPLDAPRGHGRSSSDTFDPDASHNAKDAQPLSSDDFYELLGLRAPSSLQEAQEKPYKLATRGGLYKMITEELNAVHRQYRIFDAFTYIFLGLQIVIGAVFIILGALGTHSHTGIAIAVLGAVSTAIAGVLALMKGQGLPNRLRHAVDQLRNVVFRAEELYWNFRAGRPVSFNDVKALRELYIDTLKAMNRNHPDTWNDAPAGVAKGAGGGKVGR